MSITNNAFLSNSLTNTYTCIYASNISLNILYWLCSSINTLFFVKKAIYKILLSIVMIMLCTHNSLASNTSSKADSVKELNAEHKISHKKIKNL